MGLTLGIALYFIIWWTMLFAVLPFGLQTQDEVGEIVPGTPESAPARPRLVRIFLANTLLATVVFAIVWAVIAYGIVSVDTGGVVPGMR